MRKAVIGGVLVALLLVTGCAAGAYNADLYVSAAEAWREIDRSLMDGRTVHCLLYSPSNHGVAMSCDWENAR